MDVIELRQTKDSDVIDFLKLFTKQNDEQLKSILKSVIVVVKTSISILPFLKHYHCY